MRNEQPLISVIVPVFNAEKYLNECLSSIRCQTYSNLEIVIIDDGSTDTSAEICDAYANLDKRFVVFHITNKGVSNARNLGLDQSHGEYVLFVDSDDWIDMNYIECLWNEIGKFDIIISDFTEECEEGCMPRNYKKFDSRYSEKNIDKVLQDCIDAYIYTYVIWGKLYRKNLLNNVRFQKQPYSEDAIFIREVFDRCDKVKFLRCQGYHYRISGTGVTSDNSRVQEKITGNIKMLQCTERIFRHHNKNDKYIKQLWKKGLSDYLNVVIKSRSISGIFDYYDINQMVASSPHGNQLYLKWQVVKFMKKVHILKNNANNKVGVITIYDLLNYGNRLQNYAVHRILEDMGTYPETLVIDEIGKKELLRRLLHQEPIFNWNTRQESESFINSLDEMNRKKYDNFKAFTNHYISINKMKIIGTISKKIDDRYRFFIAGSDQIWNCTTGQAASWEFLEFATSQKCISYAASFGINHIPDRYRKKIRKGLNHIAHISVREQAGAKIVTELTGRNVEVLIDPTMMIDASDWLKIALKPKKIDCDKPYILTYFLGDCSEQAENDLNRYAAMHDLVVYNLLDYAQPDLFVSGPSEFVYLISHAKLVMTDSFHACVFSFLFRKPFLVYNRVSSKGNMISRIETLLKKFHLERKYVDSGLDNDLFEADYTEGYNQLEVERKKAMDFLKKSMNMG